MNGFDVQAVDWIVARDLWCEAARTLFGRKSTLPQTMLGELGKGWHDIVSAMNDDRMAMSDWCRIMSPRRASLSVRGQQAVMAFVEQLITCCPDRYGPRALRSRLLAAWTQVLASCLLCLVLGRYASPENATLAQAVLVFFVMGCWSRMVGVQLLRMHRLVGRFDAKQPASAKEPAPE